MTLPGQKDPLGGDAPRRRLVGLAVTLGLPLQMDPRTERFTGGASLSEANELLTRPYRPGFVVPDKA